MQTSTVTIDPLEASARATRLRTRYHRLLRVQAASRTSFRWTFATSVILLGVAVMHLTPLVYLGASASALAFAFSALCSFVVTRHLERLASTLPQALNDASRARLTARTRPRT